MNSTIKLTAKSKKVLPFIKTDKTKIEFLLLKIYNLACQDYQLDSRIKMTKKNWEAEMKEIMSYAYDLKTMFGFSSTYDSMATGILKKDY